MKKQNPDITVRVARKLPVATGIALFELVHADGHDLPPFTAGAHIDVHVPGGPTRQYSLCNDPREAHRYQIAVLHEPNSRGGSRGMHERVQEGQELRIGEPRNHFPLVEGACKSLLLAGGIGLTPLMSMASALAAAGASFELHCCARSRDRVAFADQLQGSAFGSRVHLHFDDGDEAQKLNLDELLAVPSIDVHLYTCGPKGFMDAVLAKAREQGWSEQQLHYEFFAAEPVKNASDGGFDVQIASTGKVVTVAPDQSIVAALSAEGVTIPVSCEQGVCGTCLTRVLEGEPDHRDMYLTQDEQSANDQILPCCSRAKSARLVLDL